MVILLSVLYLLTEGFRGGLLPIDMSLDIYFGLACQLLDPTSLLSYYFFHTKSLTLTHDLLHQHIM